MKNELVILRTDAICLADIRTDTSELTIYDAESTLLERIKDALINTFNPLLKKFSVPGRPEFVIRSVRDQKSGMRPWWVSLVVDQSAQQDMFSAGGQAEIDEISRIVQEVFILAHELSASTHEVITLTYDPAKNGLQTYLYSPSEIVIFTLWSFVKNSRHLKGVKIRLHGQTLTFPELGIRNDAHEDTAEYLLSGIIDTMTDSGRTLTLHAPNEDGTVEKLTCSFPVEMRDLLAESYSKGTKICVHARRVRRRVRLDGMKSNRFKIIDSTDLDESIPNQYMLIS